MSCPHQSQPKSRVVSNLGLFARERPRAGTDSASTASSRLAVKLSCPEATTRLGCLADHSGRLQAAAEMGGGQSGRQEDHSDSEQGSPGSKPIHCPPETYHPSHRRGHDARAEGRKDTGKHMVGGYFLQKREHNGGDRGNAAAEDDDQRDREGNITDQLEPPDSETTDRHRPGNHAQLGAQVSLLHPGEPRRRDKHPPAEKRPEHAEFHRTRNRHSAEIKYPAALMNRTFCSPMVAIPRPLNAGPTSTAMFTPPCMSALAAVNWGRETIDGTAAERAGPKMVDAMAIRKTM